MSNISKTYRVMATAYTGEVHAPRLSEGILRHTTNLILYFFTLLNGMLGLRFLLKLMALTETHPLASLVYSLTSPFVGAFQGLMPIFFFQGGEIELLSLAAIVVYAIRGWLIIQALWLFSTRTK